MCWWTKIWSFQHEFVTIYLILLYCLDVLMVSEPRSDHEVDVDGSSPIATGWSWSFKFVAQELKIKQVKLLIPSWWFCQRNPIGWIKWGSKRSAPKQRLLYGLPLASPAPARTYQSLVRTLAQPFSWKSGGPQHLGLIYGWLFVVCINYVWLLIMCLVGD